MALVRFGDIAVEWSRVYALVRSFATDEEHPFTEPVEVYADFPDADLSKPFIRLSVPAHRNAIWAYAKDDGRFTEFDGVLLDMSRVGIVARTEDGKQANVMFLLPDGRSATVRVTPDLAGLILASISTARRPA